MNAADKLRFHLCVEYHFWFMWLELSLQVENKIARVLRIMLKGDCWIIVLGFVEIEVAQCHVYDDVCWKLGLNWL